MNTEFIQGLFHSLSPVNRRILGTMVSLQEKATSVRESTAILPVELSIMIASSAVRDACYDMYAKILEIAILLFIRDNEDDFYIAKRRSRSSGERVAVVEAEDQADFMQKRFLVDEMFNFGKLRFLKRIVRELSHGSMWSEILSHIDDENIIQSILGHEQLHIHSPDLQLITDYIAPRAFSLFYKRRVYVNRNGRVPNRADIVLYNRFFSNLGFKSTLICRQSGFREIE